MIMNKEELIRLHLRPFAVPFLIFVVFTPILGCFCGNAVLVSLWIASHFHSDILADAAGERTPDRETPVRLSNRLRP
jgi:hypothetical protein